MWIHLPNDKEVSVTPEARREQIMKPGILFIIPAIVMVAGCAVVGGLRPTTRQFSSQWLDIDMGGLMASPGGEPALQLLLRNRSEKQLEVVVAFATPDPTQSCHVAKQLNGGQTAFFTCPQTSITANTDYPISISIYGDKERRNLLENPRTKFFFREEGVKEFEALRKKLEAEKSR